MTIEKWKEILSCEGMSDVLTDQSYNEDYSHEIHLTVKEIRQIANLLEARVSLQGADTFKIYECEMCGEILEAPGRFCSDECANENAYMYRTCKTCGGEFWDGGTSCTCEDYEDDILEDPTLDPKINPLE